MTRFNLQNSVEKELGNLPFSAPTEARKADKALCVFYCTFDDLLVRKVVEMVKVESTEKLEITFKDGKRRIITVS